MSDYGAEDGLLLYWAHDHQMNSASSKFTPQIAVTNLTFRRFRGPVTRGC